MWNVAIIKRERIIEGNECEDSSDCATSEFTLFLSFRRLYSRERRKRDVRMRECDSFGCPVRQFNVQLFVEKVFIAQKISENEKCEERGLTGATKQINV